MSETGVVKFHSAHTEVRLETFPGFDELNECRRQLIAHRWLGVDENGIGFGNLSVRDDHTARFFITGSGSGAKVELTPNDCVHVIECDFDRNWLRCEGAIVASSESLTHAAVYRFCAAVGAVIHIHDEGLWQRSIGNVPSTSEDVEYGTPGMAHEVGRLFRETNIVDAKLFRMTGHRGGLVAFGSTMREAFVVLEAFNRKLPNFPATAE